MALASPRGRPTGRCSAWGPLAAFALAYGRVALHRDWRAAVAAGWLAAALAAVAVGTLAAGTGSPVGLLIATSGARAGGPGAARGRQPRRRRRGRAAGSFPLRMASAALLVVSLSAAAGALGAVAGGMVAALPVLACVLAVFTHREQGAAATIALLRGMLAGMGAFVLFCQVIALAIVPFGITPAFVAATVVALATQAIAVYPPAAVHSLLRRQSSAARPAVAAAPGSLGRQSS